MMEILVKKAIAHYSTQCMSYYGLSALFLREKAIQRLKDT